MIVSRRYIPFCELVRVDKYSKNIIKKAYYDSFKSEAEMNEHWEIMCRNYISVFNADMSCCFPGLGYIREEFERLDRSNPYDNGFDFDYVNKAEILMRSEDEITLQLVHRCSDGNVLVGVVTINNENLHLYNNTF